MAWFLLGRGAMESYPWTVPHNSHSPKVEERRTMRILVADDEPDIVLGLSERLTWMGHEVVTAGDGQAALSAVESHAVDLVMLDVMMPRMSGIDALKQIHKRWPNLPVVILTAHGTIRLAVEAMKEGAVDYVTKPFLPGDIDSVVARAMEQSGHNTDISQLLGEVTHDTKNLLMPLVTGTDLLAEEINDLFKQLPKSRPNGGQDSQQACEEVLQLFRTTAERIQERMKGIADYVAVNQAPWKSEACQLGKIVDQVAKSLRVLLRQKQISLQVEGLDALPVVMGSSHRLYSALYNLVHNAIPEVPIGGTITVRGRHDSDAQAIVLTVMDTGRGMPPALRDGLFTNHRMSTKSGGTGLGMKIVKDAIAAHGGRIAVESEEGKGTTFTIHLPIQPAV